MDGSIRHITLTLNPAVDCTLRSAGPLSFAGPNRIVREDQSPGGKGINVAKVLAANGLPVCAAGLIGRADEARFRGFLRPLGVETDFFAVPHRTRRNLMFVDDQGGEMKFNRPGFPRLAYDAAAIEAYAMRFAVPGAVIVLSGSLPARFPVDAWARLARLYRGAGCRVVVDTSGEPLRLAAAERPWVAKPNRAECLAWLGRAELRADEIRDALLGLTPGVRVVVMSDGANGAFFASDGTVLHARPPAVAALDSTGAGDALLGQFCADYFAATPPRVTESVARRAVAAGAAYTELPGTPAPDMARVRALAAASTVRPL